MRLPLLISLLLFLALESVVPPAVAQVADTIEASKAGKIAKSDELYFAAIKAKMHDEDKQATDLLEQFIAVRPDVSAAYYELSMFNYRAKNVEKAEENIKKAITYDKSNKWYKEQYATILAEKGDFAEAAKIMADLAKSDPEDPSYLIAASDYFQHAKKYDEALQYIDKAIDANGPDDDLLERKIQLYLSMNNVDKAAEVVRGMIVRDPRNARYYKFLGELYDNNKMPDKASKVYQDAQKLFPDDPSIELGMALHYMDMGDSSSYVIYLKKAILNNDLDSETQLGLLQSFVKNQSNDSIARVQGMPIIRQLAALHPADPDIIAYYGDILEANHQTDSAVMAYKKSLAIKPANFNVWGSLLECYLETKDYDSVIKYTEKAIRLFPNQAIVHFYNGIGHQNKKEYPAAIKAMNRAIDLQPENDRRILTYMYSELAEVYHLNKQDDLSDQAFEKALKTITPNDESLPTLLNNYAYYLSERGVKLDEAEKMSKTSLDMRPGVPTFLDTYGWIEYQKKDYAKAKEYIQKAVDLSGNKADATLYDHMGNIYFKLNNKEKAVEYWRKSKEKGNDDPKIDKKISDGKLYE